MHPDVGMRSRQKSRHSHIHRQATLDAVEHPAGDRGLLLERPLDIVPDFAAHGLLPRERNPPRRFIVRLDPNINAVARRDRHLTFVVQEFGEWGGNFRFQTEINDDLAVCYLQNLALHNLAGRQGSRGKLLHSRQQIRHVTAFRIAHAGRTHFNGLFKVSGSNLL